MMVSGSPGIPDEKQLTGAGDRGRIDAGLNHRNTPFQSSDVLTVTGVLPLINMVLSQEDSSLMVPVALDR